MKRALFLFAAILLANFTGNAQTADRTSANLRADLEDISKKMEAAIADGDYEGFGTFFTDDVMMKMSGSEPMSGRVAVVAAHKPLAENGMKLNINTDEVMDFGEYAYQLGNYEILTPDGQKLDYGNFATLWQKENGQWKIYRDIISTSVSNGNH